MVSRKSAKAKGHLEEKFLQDYLIANGFPHAHIRNKEGKNDRGDIGGVEGWVLEAKAVKTYAIPSWLAEADREADNAGVINRVVVMKPNGIGFPNIADHWAVMPLWNWVDLVRKDIEA